MSDRRESTGHWTEKKWRLTSDSTSSQWPVKLLKRRLVLKEQIIL